jgi:hypothetical protein
MVLAIGHAPSVDQPMTQLRWRFTTGSNLVYGLYQAGLMGVAGSAVYFRGAWLLILCAAIWAGTVWWYGRRLLPED